jgi:hypothetical protein
VLVAASIAAPDVVIAQNQVSRNGRGCANLPGATQGQLNFDPIA